MVPARYKYVGYDECVGEEIITFKHRSVPEFLEGEQIQEDSKMCLKRFSYRGCAFSPDAC